MAAILEKLIFQTAGIGGSEGHALTPAFNNKAGIKEEYFGRVKNLKRRPVPRKARWRKLRPPWAEKFISAAAQVMKKIVPVTVQRLKGNPRVCLRVHLFHLVRRPQVPVLLKAERPQPVMHRP